MKKYEMKLDTERWQCGDGCCDGERTTVTVNEMEIGTYGDLSMENFNALELFITMLNENDSELILSYSAQLDRDGDLSDAIYLNETLIANSVWGCEVYGDILDRFQLQYLYRNYDLDWDIWQKEKHLVLELEEEMLKNARNQ